MIKEYIIIIALNTAVAPPIPDFNPHHPALVLSKFYSLSGCISRMHLAACSTCIKGHCV